MLLLTQSARAQQVFSGAGNAQTTTALNNFRAALGTDNGAGAGAQVGGRREINWDAVRLDGTDFNNVTTVIVPNKITGIPVNRFQARGIVFKEVFAVAGDGFTAANAGVADQFPAFSPANTFAPFNSNKLEVSFALSSAPTTTPVAGATRGFGVIFLDVELANTTSIEYFNGAVSLGKFFAPVGASGQAEFLGVLFNAPVVTRAVITLGTSQIFNFANNQVTAGLPDQAPIYDQVATDDFIYAEPVAATSAATAFAGAGTAEATTSLNAFRTAAGTDNGTAPPPQTSGRREINWDAVRLDGTDFNNVTTVIVPNKITGIPVNRFQARGALFGEVLAVSGDGFASANAAATNQFPAFSPANTFAAFNSNKYTVNFVLAAAPTTTPVPAATRGFGAIFLDVEVANTSSIEYFNGAISLGKFFVPVTNSGQPEFLGVLFNAPVVTHVVVTAGTAQVFNFANGQVTAGPAESATTDLAVVDDFIYAEPVLTATSVSAASYLGAALAPEAISVAFGAALAGSTVIADSTPLPTALAGTSLKIKDSTNTERLAPLFFVSPGQINYLVPTGTAVGDALVTITDGSGRIAPSRARIEAVAPGLFSANASGQGVAAAVALRVKANNELVYEPLFRFDAASQRFVSVPVDLGPATETVYIILYGTGIRFRSGLSGVKATIGGADSMVTYAGGQTGLAGLDQINAFLPRELAGKGEVDVVLTVDGKPTNTVKINVK
ncbi:MAG TPA: hypothetical protein PLD20_03715 [Blastocatellia bacterium]|nr:hypothetical protein [Blastocatellia bacterium]